MNMEVFPFKGIVYGAFTIIIYGKTVSADLKYKFWHKWQVKKIMLQEK